MLIEEGEMLIEEGMLLKKGMKNKDAKKKVMKITRVCKRLGSN